jgi:DNA-binding Xre family transcriptional regulator
MPGIRRVDFKKVDRLRLDFGLNKQSFCRKAGIACFTYNRLDSAKKVKDDVIFRIAKALDVRPSELIFWQDES